MKTISSRQNPLVKRIREALREHAAEIVIEGPKAVADARAAGWRPLAIMQTESSEAVADPLVTAVTAEVYQHITETRSPQGVLGLFERPQASAAEILARRDSIAVALDGVQDPGNVGTIVRLAAAFDAAGVLLLPGCADAFGPKAIRASAGAILTVPVARIAMAELFAAELPIYATAAAGETVDPPARNAVLVFGNEGAGVSRPLLERATAIAIPMAPRVESLNVATSAAILLARSYAVRR
jgi:TrmH family RNA methyltransferase